MSTFIAGTGNITERVTEEPVICDKEEVGNEQTENEVMPGGCRVCSGVGSKQCSKCKRVVYCSRECQVLDWKVHKRECTQKKK